MPQILTHTGFAHLTDLPCITLTCGTARAVVSLYGGQLLSYQPLPGQEQLWLSPLAGWHNQAIRGGIPICWPWFGPIATQLNPQAMPMPNHGLVRTAMWQCSAEELTAHYSRIRLVVTPENLPYCQIPLTLSLTVTLTNSSLQLELDCPQPILQQAALHSYFQVERLHAVDLSPLPVHYYDKVLAGQFVKDENPLQFNQEIDRIYPATAEQLMLTAAGSKRLLQQQGHDATVVWNPWQERCKALNDMQAESYLQFVCVETAKLDLTKPLPLALSLTLTS